MATPSTTELPGFTRSDDPPLLDAWGGGGKSAPYTFRRSGFSCLPGGGMVLATRHAAVVTHAHATGDVPRWASLILTAALLVAAEGCSVSDEQSRGTPSGAPPQGSEPFVVFTASDILITQLGSAVAAPVTLGSQPSPATLVSDAPGSVEVAADGALVGRRNGSSVVRSAGSGSALRVRVEAAAGVKLDPAHFTLRSGGSLRLRLLAAEDGRELPGDAAAWESSAPEVLWVSGGDASARRPGVALITATYGGLRTTAGARVDAAGRSPSGDP